MFLISLLMISIFSTGTLSVSSHWSRRYDTWRISSKRSFVHQLFGFTFEKTLAKCSFFTHEIIHGTSSEIVLIKTFLNFNKLIKKNFLFSFFYLTLHKNDWLTNIVFYKIDLTFFFSVTQLKSHCMLRFHSIIIIIIEK